MCVYTYIYIYIYIKCSWGGSALHWNDDNWTNATGSPLGKWQSFETYHWQVKIRRNMPLEIQLNMPLKIHDDFWDVDFWCAIFCPSRGSAPKWGRHTTICFQVSICAVAAWWFGNPHKQVVPRSRIPKFTLVFVLALVLLLWLLLLLSSWLCMVLLLLPLLLGAGFLGAPPISLYPATWKHGWSKHGSSRIH